MTGVDAVSRADAAPALDRAGVPVTERTHNHGPLRPGSPPRHAAAVSWRRLARPTWRREPREPREPRRPREPARPGVTAAVVDCLLWIVAAEWAAACRFDFDLDRVSWLPVTCFAVEAGLAQVAAGHVLSMYRNRYPVGSFDEVLMLSASVLVVSMLGSAQAVAFPVNGLPRSLPALAFPFALVLTGAARYLRRLATERRRRPAPGAERVLIYGAGNMGAQLAQRMLRDPRSPFLPVGFLYDDRGKRNLRNSGIRVLGARGALPAAAKATAATGVVIAIDHADAALIRGVRDAAAVAGLRCTVAPRLNQLADDRATPATVRDVDVQDMIGRHPVDTDVAAIAHYLTGKRIVLTDIRDGESLNAIFAELGPEVVFHAAALKHLPLLERYPLEAWNTNVIGTLNVLEAAAGAGVRRLVNISTDKAADPVSALGYSKRLAEQLTSWMSRRIEGSYLSVRFGNVLG